MSWSFDFTSGGFVKPYETRLKCEAAAVPSNLRHGLPPWATLAVLSQSVLSFVGNIPELSCSVATTSLLRCFPIAKAAGPSRTAQVVLLMITRECLTVTVLAGLPITQTLCLQ